MNIQHIEAFVNVYTTRNFARTAELMFITQSRVSQRIKSMENELGEKLFERSNHKVTPTEAGETFYPYAFNILQIYGEGVSAINSDKKNFYIHTQAINYLSPINKAMTILSYNHPDASFKILKPFYNSNAITSDMLIPRHLFLVRKNWIKDENISFFELGMPYFSVIMNKDNPLSKKDRVTVDDIHDMTVYAMALNGGAQSFAGPYLGELRLLIEARNNRIESVMSSSEMFSVLASSGEKCVYVMSNTMAVDDDMPVVMRRLYVNDDIPVGFVYTGDLTEYMMEFMSTAKMLVSEQAKNEY